MNKKLVAAALGLAFAAPVFADSSNVVLYGRIHQAIEHNTSDLNGADPASAGNGTNIADYSSRLGVRGVEDLGGGLSAIFAYEFGVDTDSSVNTTANTTSPLTTRHAYLGLKGSFGTVVIGSQDGGNDSQAPLYNQASAYVFNVNNNAGQLTVVNGNDAVINRVQRVGNSIGYANTIAGVKISARHALGGADAASGVTASSENNVRESSIAADYTIGALTIGGGYTRVEATTALENTNAPSFPGAATNLKSQVQLGAKYNFGAFQLGGLIGQSKYFGDRASDTDYAISGLVPLSANSGVQALYAQAENGRVERDSAAVAPTPTLAQNPAGRETDNTQVQLSYYYDFSKRTRSYVGFNRTTREAFEVTTGANREVEEDSFVVGLRHNF
jgi:predicted porin